jgi:hypothetical protein
MALVWCDGFEGYGDTDNTPPAPTNVLADKYATVNEETYLRIRNVSRTDGWSLLLNTATTSQGYIVTDDVVSGNTCVAGLAYYTRYASFPYYNQRWPLMVFRNTDGNANVELLLSNGYMWVVGPNRTFLGSCRSPSVLEKFNYVEMKVYHHATSGTVEVRINGCPVFVKSGLDTLYASTKPTIAVSVGGAYDAEYNYLSLVDDFYVCDGTGSDNTDFLGPISIETFWAASDDTTEFATTGNANYSTHYEQVIREERDETTDYVEDSTTGNTDVFGMDAAPTYNSVKGVVIWGAVEYSGGTANYRFSLESSNTTTYSSNTVCPSSVEIHSFVVENDPSTSSAFTSSALDSILCGTEVAS